MRRRVIAPTLLIVSIDDVAAVDSNRQAYKRLRREKALEAISGGGALFDQPEQFARVTEFATRWFADHLS